MKKGIFMAGFALVLLAACSDDDNNGNSTPDQTRLFTSSNTTGMISITDLTDGMNQVKSFMGGSMDADGIYYNESTDEIYQASRTNNRIDVYDGIGNALEMNLAALNLSMSSTADFTNAREIAVSGNLVIVAQDQSDANGLQNKLYVYRRNGGMFTLENTYDVTIKLWGIHYEDGTLYAVVDNTGDIAVFNNFTSNPSGAVTADKRVTIEGLVRTHGITYSDDDNVMVLTDVGLAASDSDGGLIVISNFSSVLSSTADGGTIALSAQKRIYGAASKLGNPVDVAYDDDTNMIYVAERLNGGGQVLTFAMPTAAQADVAPMNSRNEAGVSAVYLQD